MTQNRQVIFFLIAVSAFLFFYRLGNTALTNWDEAWFGSVASDMAATGNLLAGRWNGQTFFYEPPLLVWLLSLTIKIFGESEFWLRAVSAIAGIFTVLGCYFLAFKITKSRLAGLLSGLIILSDIEFLFRGRQVNVEILLTVLLLWSMIFMIKSLDNNKRKWIFFSAVCLGLAFLTKRASPVLALPAIGYLLLKAKFTLRKSIIFFITFITVVFPWYLFSFLKWGDQFINEFFIGYTFNKIKSVNLDFGTSPFFYLTAIKHAFKLWFLVLILIPLISFKFPYYPLKQRFPRREIRGNNHPTKAILIFVIVFFLGLTLAPIKSSWFLLPIHPAIAVILGIFIDNNLKRPGLFKKAWPYMALSGVTLVSIYQIWHYRYDFIVPDTTGRQAALAKLAGQLTPPQKPIYLDDDYLPVAVFYSRRQVIPLRFNRLQPITPLPIPSGSYILTNTETLPTLKNNYPNILPVKETSGLILVQI